MKNRMEIKFSSISQNESFARSVVSAFMLPLNPSVSQLSDVKTAVSEAVTNAIVHGYPDTEGVVTIIAEIEDSSIHIIISDSGIGIDNLQQALEPFYTTKPNEERSGMGFTIINTFMDDVKIISKSNYGTTVDMRKEITATLDDM